MEEKNTILPPAEVKSFIANQRRKRKTKITLEIYDHDLNAIKNLATMNGLKYQTLVRDYLGLLGSNARKSVLEKTKFSPRSLG